MKEYPIKANNKKDYLNRESFKYEINTTKSVLIEELLSAPSNISDIEERIYSFADCGECPGCACISGDLDFLAVIEAPATVPLLVIVGGMRFTS